MLLDEQELRQHLTAAAGQASAPRFTVDGLAARIRRRRARLIGLLSGSLLAVAVLAVTVPIGLRGGGGGVPLGRPGVAPFRLSYTVAVNGQSRVFPRNGPPPTLTVTPGEKLRIDVGVIVPPHATLTGLWLGITNSMLSPRRNGPADMHPILAARTRAPLRHGVHRFTLHWAVPARLLPGATRQVSIEWAWSQFPPGDGEQIVAQFDVEGGAGT